MRLKTYLMLCVLAFAIGSGIGFVWPTIAQTLQQQPQQAQDPNQGEGTNRYVPGTKKLQPQNIILSYQPDMPLEITAIKEEFADGRDVIRVTLTTTSYKPIRAYGIKILSYDRLEDTRHSFSALSSSSSFTLKGQFTFGTPITETLSESFLEAEKILIVIDFVEFEDGHIWGPNSEAEYDRVQGKRAGMLAATEKLISMLAQEGSKVLLPEQTLAISIPNSESHSKKWQAGFKRGIEIVQSLLNDDHTPEKRKARLFDMHSELKSLSEQDNEQQ